MPVLGRWPSSGADWSRKSTCSVTADDGLDALLAQRFGKFQRAEKIAGVGDGERRHAHLPGKRRHLLDMQGALGQRIGRMGPQMDERDAAVCDRPPWPGSLSADSAPTMSRHQRRPIHKSISRACRLTILEPDHARHPPGKINIVGGNQGAQPFLA